MKEHIHGGDIYKYQGVLDFSTNCNPLGLPQRVKEKIVESIESLHQYPEVGYPALKEALAVYEGVPSESVICGNGAAELLFSLCLAVKPKRALLLAPSFAEYEQALESADCSIEYAFLSEAAGFEVQKDLLDRIHPELDIMFLCNPNNPTGLLTSKQLLLAILQKCQECRCQLVVDECFMDFVEDRQSYTIVDQLSPYEDTLFILKAFTKRYAMAGIRLGYGLSANHTLLAKIRQVTQPWNVSTIAQQAGIAALQEEEFVRHSMQLIHRERRYLLSSLADTDLIVYEGKANYLFFKTTLPLWERCLAHQILIRDCQNYTGLTAGYYRVAVRTHEENVRLVEVLRRIMTESEEA
ncbi:MAG: threonine-phosphate decarboxylase CobD [Lachnospiraceae bacterium]